LKRTLALELLHLDEIEEAFRDKAIEDRDVASGTLLVKIAERRAALLGLNASALCQKQTYAAQQKVAYSIIGLKGFSYGSTVAPGGVFWGR
jgi:hypothetical protein